MSVKCSNIKIRDHVIVDGRPCRVMNISNQNEEIELSVSDIFRFNTTNVKYHPDENIDIPVISKSDFQLIDVSDDGMILLMQDDGFSFEMKSPCPT